MAAMGNSSTVISAETPDVQAGAPRTLLSLSRVGVTGVEKVLRVRPAAGEPQLYYAELECLVDLNPHQAGVHMSRFEEVVGEVIDEVMIAARYPETVRTPHTALETQEIYTLFGTAVSSERGTRTLTGVEAQGMTACPCAQGLVESRSRERLAAAGFDDDEIERALEAIPAATHNQRGIGTLHIGRTEGSDVDIDAPDLLHIVEQSMSSEIYGLMKRSDEVEVVEKAHRRPRFVEDCVREMVRRVCEAYPQLGAGAFLHARQENLETIHRHNVVAERYGLLSEIRAEIDSGEHSRNHVTKREWLQEPLA